MQKSKENPIKIVQINLKRLANYLFDRARMRLIVSNDKKNQKDVIANKQIFGKSISLNLKDLDQRYLFEDHIREPENIFVYSALARAGLCNTFIDIGANFGHDAILIEKEYNKVILIEPNPTAVSVLEIMFSNNEKVSIINGAIIGKDSSKELFLKVPKDSSALASIVDSPLMREDIETIRCKGYNLHECVSVADLPKSYIKIDVEGGEYDILSDIVSEVMMAKAIVGFEALSREFATKCALLFDGYTYYYAKFDFLDDDGSLMKSPFRLLMALLGIRSSISVYKINDKDFSKAPDNYSQVYCVPVEKEEDFEKAIKIMTAKAKSIDCSKFEY
jgi:FkbM family methyltransferase